jgi:hypothetical protein
MLRLSNTVKNDVSEWNENHEKILKEWKARLFVNMWLQMKTGYFYSSMNDVLTFPVIMFSSVSSATLFATNNNTARLIIAVLSIFTVILTGLMLEMSPGQRTEQHMSSTNRYAMLIRNIDFCLSIPRVMRAPPMFLIDKVSIEMDYIADNENVIPKRVICDFERKFGSLDKLLYGDEIMDLLEEDIKTTRIATRLIRKTTMKRSQSTLSSPTIRIE